jgi:hypothetical protein
LHYNAGSLHDWMRGVPVPLVTGYFSKRYLATPLSASTLPPASEQQASGTPTQEVPELHAIIFWNSFCELHLRCSAILGLVAGTGPFAARSDSCSLRREYWTARRIFLWQRELGGPNEPNRAILLDPRWRTDCLSSCRSWLGQHRHRQVCFAAGSNLRVCVSSDHGVTTGPGHKNTMAQPVENNPTTNSQYAGAR